MFIVTPETVWNPSVLATRELPRRIFGYIRIRPRRGAPLRLRLRMWFESEVLRYSVALLPFVGAVLVWRDYALAIGQAPLVMFAVVYLVEVRVLRLSPARRAALAGRAEIDRALDMFRARARAILTNVAAGRKLAAGGLHLVVEQSDMAHVAPLTFVSVQSEDGPQVLSLTADEEALIAASLFAEPLTEAAFLRVNMADNDFLRSERLDPRDLSAHARMAALLA